MIISYSLETKLIANYNYFISTKVLNTRLISSIKSLILLSRISISKLLLFNELKSIISLIKYYYNLRAL